MKEFYGRKRFKKDVDPEIIADMILELMDLARREALNDKDFSAKDLSKIWKEFYETTEIIPDDIPF